MKSIYTRLTIAILLFSGIASCSSGDKSRPLDVEEALNYCHKKVNKSLADLSANPNNYNMMPRNIEGNDTCWNCRVASAEEWCSGFWPGILWYDFENSADQKIKNEAINYTASLDSIALRPVFDHDLGFLMFCSYGNAYRLTGNQKYKDIILASADSLATLYNEHVGTILSWPRNVEMFGGHNTIMDNMINLEMLFWASKNGGSQHLYDIAVNHAETTMKNHFRPDGTCFHVAVYNPETGEFIKGMTHQGYADGSTWARGQAWAIYGYTMVYRETQDPKFLDFACKLADVYLERLPEDKVPYWDFDDPAIPNAPKDASSAGVVASALLELQNYCSDTKQQRYLDSAKDMLASLGSPSYRSMDSKDSFLDHSTGHKPAGSEIDASIIYADYYYLEALLKLKKIQQNEDEISGNDTPMLTSILNFLR